MTSIDTGSARGRHDARDAGSGLMSAFRTQVRRGTSATSRSARAQGAEAALGINGDRDRLFLEAAYRLGSTLLVVGWCSDIDGAFLHTPSGPIGRHLIRTHDRQDVAESLGVSSPKGLGISLKLEGAAEVDALLVKGRADSGFVRCPLPFRDTFSEGHWPLLGGSVLELLGAAEVGSAEWREIREAIPVVPAESVAAAGFLEGMMVSPLGEGAVVFGWAVNEADRLLWLEADDDTVVGLEDVFRQPRPDVLSLFPGKAIRDVNVGLIAFVPGLGENSRVRICAASAAGRCIVSERGRTHTLATSPLHAAQLLFGVDTGDTRMAERYAKVDAHILAPLVQRRIDQFHATAETRRDFGPTAASPDVSIIIPLYGQYHFMEHQVMEFCRDPFIGSRCEVIYVIDDPALIDEVVSEGHRLHRLFGLPLRFVWSGLNFGYSGANNLGARVAAGRNLLFLNSDVIPEGPGWLERMVAALRDDDSAGAVGAQLIFPDGGIQHAGMKFEYDTRLGVWTNQHPGAGICARLMAESEPREVPALTGACLLLSRADFDAVGGWDMGYVVGDFEDSDLCLTLRRRGLRCIYEPRARLVHLERQSISLVGLGKFRFRLTIANAQRHGDRWREILAAGEQGSPA